MLSSILAVGRFSRFMVAFELAQALHLIRSCDQIKSSFSSSKLKAKKKLYWKGKCLLEVQNILCNSLISTNINILLLIRKETHETLDAYLPNHQTAKSTFIHLVLCLCRLFIRNLGWKGCQFLILSPNIWVSLNGDNLDYMQDYDGNDGMMEWVWSEFYPAREDS